MAIYLANVRVGDDTCEGQRPPRIAGAGGRLVNQLQVKTTDLHNVRTIHRSLSRFQREFRLHFKFMLPPQPIRLMLIISAICILLFLGLDVWYGAEANLVAGDAKTSDICSSHSPSRLVEDRCDSRLQAIYAASASAALQALLLFSYLALNWLRARVWSGRLQFLTGCRWGYRIALVTSVAAWIILIGVLYPVAVSLTFMRFLGIYWLDLDNFMIGIMLVIAIGGLAAFIRGSAGLPIPEDVRLSGSVVTEDDQPHLFPAIRQIVQSAKCAMPGNVVLGLDPAVICTARRVLVEEKLLTGGTLYISLLCYRLLSESELMSLVTAAIIPVQIVSEESENWVVTTGQRWALRRDRLQQAAFPMLGIAMTFVWYWLDMWANWQAEINGFAIRRAAVLTGRENVAAALSKAAMFLRRWPSFLTEIQANLRRSQLQADQLNLVSMFASRMAGPLDEVVTEVLSSPWVLGLGVNPDKLKNRLGDMEARAPAGWIVGAHAMENELSMTQIKRMVFLREPAKFS